MLKRASELTSNQEAFFSWLSITISKPQYSSFYMVASELDRYCVSKHLVSSTFFELEDEDAVSHLRVRLEGDRIFKFLNRGKTEQMLQLLKQYSNFLCVKGKEAETQDKAPYDSESYNQQLEENLTSSSASTKNKGTINSAIEKVAIKESNAQAVIDPFKQFLYEEKKSPEVIQELLTALALVDDMINASTDMNETLRSCKTFKQASTVLINLLLNPRFKQLNSSHGKIPMLAVQAYLRMLKNQEDQKAKGPSDTITSTTQYKESKEPSSTSAHSRVTEAATAEVANNTTAIDKHHQVVGNQDPVIQYLMKHDIPYMDKRSQGGSLWILSGMNISKQILELHGMGYTFRFSPAGGKTSKENPAWYLSSDGSSRTKNSAPQVIIPTVTEVEKKAPKSAESISNEASLLHEQRRKQFELWLSATPSYKNYFGSILVETKDVNRYLQKAHLVADSLFELSTDDEVIQLLADMTNAPNPSNTSRVNKLFLSQVLRCYRHFLKECQEDKNEKVHVETLITNTDHHTNKLSDELKELLAGEELELLRNELAKQSILTVDQLKAENLWVFMNRHNLYSISQRQSVYKLVLGKMRGPSLLDNSQQYILVTKQKKYYGESPAAAFLEFCEFIAMKYPLKIRSLLDAQYNGQGSVVLSRTDNGNSLKLMSPVAYITKSLTTQAAVFYGQWICKMCGELDRPIRMEVPKIEKTIPTAKPAPSILPLNSSTHVSSNPQAPVVSTAFLNKDAKEEKTAETTMPVLIPPKPELAPQSEPASQPASSSRVSIKMIEKAESIVLKADLDGISRDSLCAELDTTMVATKDIIAASQRIVSLDSKLYHEEAFVDWEDGADKMEDILDKLLDKNNGYVTSTQFYEFVRVRMPMFLNDNDISTERMVYDMARHLFEKKHYHGKSLSFSANKHISRDKSVTSVLDLIRNYAREQGGCFQEEDLVEYLQSVGMKTGNLRGIMRVYEEPIFFFYDEHVYMTAESMAMNDEWFESVQKALNKLFDDMGDHVVLRDIQSWWFSMLPILPGRREWTPLLLQSVLMHYSEKLSGIHTIYGLAGQSGDTLHAMIVTADSDIQTFADAVIAVIVDDETTQRTFEAEELRQLLVRRGLVAGNELIWKMPKVLANDERFAWDASENNVRIKV